MLRFCPRHDIIITRVERNEVSKRCPNTSDPIVHRFYCSGLKSGCCCILEALRVYIGTSHGKDHAHRRPQCCVCVSNYAFTGCTGFLSLCVCARVHAYVCMHVCTDTSPHPGSKSVINSSLLRPPDWSTMLSLGQQVGWDAALSHGMPSMSKCMCVCVFMVI